MSKHKWHKEIKAWADGAEIEQYGTHYPSKGWHEFDGTFCDDAEWEFRIKPQPKQFVCNCGKCNFEIKQEAKEPQYLYVYYNKDGITDISVKDTGANDYWQLVGKIKLEQDDEY